MTCKAHPTGVGGPTAVPWAFRATDKLGTRIEVFYISRLRSIVVA